MMRLTDVLIVEDHTMFREVFTKAARFEFPHAQVASCGSVAEARAELARKRSALLIVDLYLPDGSGLDLIRAFAGENATLKPIVISSHLSNYMIYLIRQLKVSGFIDKSSEVVDSFRQACRDIASGGEYFSPRFHAGLKICEGDPDFFGKILTPGEIRLMTLIGNAMTDEEIGSLLTISPATVQTHRSHIMRKLKIPGTPKLIQYAQEQGFFLPMPLVGRSRPLFASL